MNWMRKSDKKAMENDCPMSIILTNADEVVKLNIELNRKGVTEIILNKQDDFFVKNYFQN